MDELSLRTGNECPEMLRSHSYLPLTAFHMWLLLTFLWVYYEICKILNISYGLSTEVILLSTNLNFHINKEKKKQLIFPYAAAEENNNNNNNTKIKATQYQTALDHNLLKCCDFKKASLMISGNLRYNFLISEAGSFGIIHFLLWSSIYLNHKLQTSKFRGDVCPFKH